MSLKRVSRLFMYAIVPAIAGVFMVAQAAHADPEAAPVPASPGIILPGDNGSLTIIPADDSKARIEYRKILGMGKGEDKDRGEAARTDKDKAWDKDRDMKGHPGDTRAPGSSGVTEHDKGIKKHDRDMGSDAEKTHQDRDAGTSGFRYVIWPFDSDKDKAEKIDQDKTSQPLGSAPADKDAAEKHYYDKDDAKTYDKDMSDSGKSTEYLLVGSDKDADLSESTDRDLSESTDSDMKSSDKDLSDKDISEETDSSTNATESMLLLAAAGAGSGGSGAAGSGTTGMGAGNSGNMGSTNQGAGSAAPGTAGGMTPPRTGMDMDRGATGSPGLSDLGTGDTTTRGSSRDRGAADMDQSVTPGSPMSPNQADRM